MAMPPGLPISGSRFSLAPEALYVLRRRRGGRAGKGRWGNRIPGADPLRPTNRVRVAIWICALSSAATRSTSPGRESPQITRSSRRSTAPFPAECLNAHWFMSPADAQKNWRTGAFLRRENGGTIKPISATPSRTVCACCRGARPSAPLDRARF